MIDNSMTGVNISKGMTQMPNVPSAPYAVSQDTMIDTSVLPMYQFPDSAMLFGVHILQQININTNTTQAQLAI